MSADGNKFYGGLSVAPAAGATPAPLLVADRTIHVDSVLGNDIGDGSSVLPFATRARAWTERLKYGELRAKLIVQYHGVGPYTMTVCGASVCGDNGYYIEQGDPAVDVSIATGTFTGDLNTTTYAIGTSAGLGSDTLKTYFLEITSGNCLGTRTNIVINTDTSITIPNRSWRTTLGAVANGDTFRVYAPGTVVAVNAPASGAEPVGFTNWAGGGAGLFVLQNGARHIMYNLALSGAGSLAVRTSAVAFVGVRSTMSGTFRIDDRATATFGFRADGSILGVGAASATNKLFCCGTSFAGTGSYLCTGGSVAAGVYYAGAGGITIGSGSMGDTVVFAGGRHDGTINIASGRFEMSGSTNQYSYFAKTVTVQLRAACLLVTNAGAAVVFAVTSGDCLSVQRDGFVRIDTGGVAGLSGGTSDVAGYGIKLSNAGGRVVISGAPTLTGGTAAADIKTTNLTKANAFFAAAGDFVSDMGGAETIVRV